MIPLIQHPKYARRRWTGAVHAWQHRVFVRAQSRREVEMGRLAEAGFRPEVCACGGIRYAEPPVHSNGLTVLVSRCTGCGTGQVIPGVITDSRCTGCGTGQVIPGVVQA